jgi:hypothetical protein
MKTLPPAIYQYLGVLTNGDFGPYTFYTSRRGNLVFFPKTWPKDPATYHQSLNRDRWRAAGVRWRSVTQQTRDLWSLMARRANLTITGYNLFVYYIIGKNVKVIETIQRNTGIDVITPTGDPIPYLRI